MKRRVRKDRFRSKYMDLDYEGMSEEDFSKIKKGVYTSMIVRSSTGILLFILGIVAIIFGGIYLW